MQPISKVFHFIYALFSSQIHADSACVDPQIGPAFEALRNQGVPEITMSVAKAPPLTHELLLL